MTYLRRGDRTFKMHTANVQRFLAEIADPTDRFLTEEHWDELKLHLSHLGDRRRVWPPGVDRSIRKSSNLAATFETMFVADIHTVPEDDLALYTDYWKHKFERFLSSFIVVDQQVWRSTHLPHLAVALRGREVALGLETDDVHGPNYGAGQPDGGVQQYFFPLTGLDDATSFAIAIAAEHRQQPKIDPELAILGLDPFAIPEGNDARELCRVAGIMAETITKRLSGEKGLLDLAKRLRTLSSAHAGGSDVGEIEDHVFHALDVPAAASPAMVLPGRTYPLEEFRTPVREMDEPSSSPARFARCSRPGLNSTRCGDILEPRSAERQNHGLHRIGDDQHVACW
ncbi:hypothetical protein HFO56_39605 [Rhizobium laguerreae]|nr:hypothetical protein [Rhizobium laguerreae]